MGYTTTAQVAAYLETELTDEQVTRLGLLIPAVESYINRETGTSFGNDTPTDIYVNGTGGPNLVIPTMHDITAVAGFNDDAEEPDVYQVTSYRAYPYGDPNKYAIRNLGGSWEEGLENFIVTGKLGFKGVPSDIKLVATELVSNTLSSNNSGYKSERVGDWSVTYGDIEKSLSTKCQDILKGYRRLSRSV